MKCYICENNCLMPDGTYGKCGLYLNQGGEIIERFTNQYLVISPITIETMPILHFQPGGKFLQISTVGCNLDCPGCISTVIVKEMGSGPTWLQKKIPEEIILEAKEKACLGISFLMNDPLACWPTFINVAKKAKENGLLVGCSSNAFFTKNSLAQILPYLDFINVGIKGFSDQKYHQCGARSAKPVWRNIKELHRAGVHVEISCMYRNDEEEDLIRIAGKVATISSDIPLQVMRFIPMEDADPGLETSIRKAEIMCRILRKYLSYVYLFNSPGTHYLTTYCSKCGEWLFKRDFYGPMGARLISSQVDVNVKVTCTNCRTEMPLETDKMRNRADCFLEPDFQGGYPFTRALEILESIIIAMDVSDRHTILQVWGEYANQKMLQKLHHDIQTPDAFLSLIRSIGKSTGNLEKAFQLAAYIELILNKIRATIAPVEEKPRVYYAMGKPLFCIKGERMENQLVETAGGINMNKIVDIAGRPGETISVDQLNALNPEVIFISAFISSSVDDFYEECIRHGVLVEAVKNRRIYNHPACGWDFGSPRWILGLMHIANTLHPHVFQFDILSEADEFYRRFYNIPFSSAETNRSFSKPSCKWRFPK